jgi:hypothetical protein
MGLLEKRALKAFQEKNNIAEINALAGFEIEFEIDWSTLALDDMSALYDEAFTKVYFDPIIGAFKDITSDEMGTEGLKEILKKIVIKNTVGTATPEYAYDFEDGTLTIDLLPFSNINCIEERTEALAKILIKQM